MYEVPVRVLENIKLYLLLRKVTTKKQ